MYPTNESLAANLVIKFGQDIYIQAGRICSASLSSYETSRHISKADSWSSCIQHNVEYDQFRELFGMAHLALSFTYSVGYYAAWA